MKKLILMLVFFPSIVFAQDAFDEQVQKKVFLKVASLLAYSVKRDDMPRVLIAENMTDEEFANAIGTDIFGNKRCNFYSWKLDAVILTLTRCDIHVLAHEFTHFFQFHFLIDKDPGKYNDMLELEACRIQDKFR